jgi:hypothetical protein
MPVNRVETRRNESHEISAAMALGPGGMAFRAVYDRGLSEKAVSEA